MPPHALAGGGKRLQIKGMRRDEQFATDWRKWHNAEYKINCASA